MTDCALDRSGLMGHMKTYRPIVVIIHFGVSPSMAVEPRATILPRGQKHRSVAAQSQRLIVGLHQFTMTRVTDIPIAHTGSPWKASSLHRFRARNLWETKSHTSIVRTQIQMPTPADPPFGKTGENLEVESRLTRRETHTNKEHPVDPWKGRE